MMQLFLRVEVDGFVFRLSHEVIQLVSYQGRHIGMHLLFLLSASSLHRGGLLIGILFIYLAIFVIQVLLKESIGLLVLFIDEVVGRDESYFLLESQVSGDLAVLLDAKVVVAGVAVRLSECGVSIVLEQGLLLVCFLEMFGAVLGSVEVLLLLEEELLLLLLSPCLDEGLDHALHSGHPDDVSAVVEVAIEAVHVLENLVADQDLLVLELGAHSHLLVFPDLLQYRDPIIFINKAYIAYISLILSMVTPNLSNISLLTFSNSSFLLKLIFKLVRQSEFNTSVKW
jgi:hypothetical protein